MFEKTYNALFVGDQGSFISEVNVNGEGYKRIAGADELHLSESVRATTEFKNLTCGNPQYDGDFQVWLLSRYDYRHFKAYVVEFKTNNGE